MCGSPLIWCVALSIVTTSEIAPPYASFFRSRTTFLVAHRITTVKEADVIVVLQHGRIVEQGTHEHLLARGDVYSDLFRQQALDDELEAFG